MRCILALLNISYRRKKNGNSAISEIVATLLMILVVVGIGTTVFAFATTSFGSFGTGWANLLTGAGNQLQEQYTIEQITFSFSSPTGANLYIRNYGVNSITVAAVYVTNATRNTFVEQYVDSPQITINSGAFQIISVTGFVPRHGYTYSFTVVTTLGSKVLANGKAS